MQWTERNSVFVPEIDAQHQAMFRLASELREAVLAEERAKQLGPVVQRLSEAIANHLAHEERLMRAAGYPALEWHERQHRTARSKLEALRREVETRERQPLFEAIESLAAWMRDHTSIADRMAGAYLRNHWRASDSGGR